MWILFKREVFVADTRFDKKSDLRWVLHKVEDREDLHVRRAVLNAQALFPYSSEFRIVRVRELLLHYCACNDLLNLNLWYEIPSKIRSTSSFPKSIRNL